MSLRGEQLFPCRVGENAPTSAISYSRSFLPGQTRTYLNITFLAAGMGGTAERHQSGVADPLSEATRPDAPAA